MSFPFFFAANELSVIAGPILARVAAGTLTKPGPWRPPEWDKKTALTAISIPGEASAPAVSGIAGIAPAYKGTPTKLYVFDAVLKADHTRELRATEHPIQTSGSSATASISDHAFRDPARVVLDIGMSDAMESYLPGVWTGSVSKSVSAFQTMVSLQASRQLFTLITRLATYQNMYLEAIEGCDTSKTLHGLRATLVFREMFLATVTAVSSGLVSDSDLQQKLSSRPQMTDKTPLGTQQAAKVPTAVSLQHKLAAAPASFPSVPGAGLWSSRNVSRIVGGLLG